MSTFLCKLTACIYFLNFYTLNSNKDSYVAYCPCMGRFGNQVEQFLGTLAFSKILNRTLILSPWISYHKIDHRPLFTSFNKYFEPGSLLYYLPVILMEKFMQQVANQSWISQERYAFCPSPRQFDKSDKPKDCNAKGGSPFGPFWDNQGINFTAGSQFYGSLPVSIEDLTDKYLNLSKRDEDIRTLWDAKFPPAQFPVLAFVGAPGAFPIRKSHRNLQRGLTWSVNIKELAHKHFYTKSNIKPLEYIGLHLRNGVDWVKTCEHVGLVNQLFSSPQCLGYNNEYGHLTQSLCYPSESEIVDQLNATLHVHKHIQNVFIASDHDYMLSMFKSHFPLVKFLDIRQLDNPQVDLYILAQSRHFIGNCVSSFTAFVVREREVNRLSSTFWGHRKINVSNTSKHLDSHQEL